MSFRGRGGGRGGGFRGGRGGFAAPTGPPAQVLEMGEFQHAVEGEMLCRSSNVKVPYFNAPIYLENKTPIGKVDEILGPINEVYFTIKPQEGIVASSFKAGDKVFIGGDKLLPLEKFLPKPKVPGEKKLKRAGGGFRGGGRGGPRGGGGGFRGRGGPRGGGGFSRGGGGRGGSGGFSRGGGRGVIDGDAFGRGRG
ncbi:gar1/Naf1 RNA binding domain-containing protein [Hirsutella rhossiliensis]|uniref:H/ACA ribonucleoprotein complex subunit n=1 Tax=Hirsutella rhossiliensis TaxID=111463 RepID=A0A9P8SKV8_9HYPO|nr:gar1/Naf1 RNA binding domain-containing protein [Hirsutella rhossiliensis]KAH0966813.1 gar1/Naf1 RNA binding domain-containing protein [Hirsutella rhossiliensis]